MKYNPPDSSIAAGRVVIQASAMERMVLHCRPDPLAAMVPATPLDRIWVVETGTPIYSAPQLAAAAPISAEAPFAFVGWVLPIFSPTVTAIRFQPTMVPRPSAMATHTFTHSGMK